MPGKPVSFQCGKLFHIVVNTPVFVKVSSGSRYDIVGHMNVTVVVPTIRNLAFLEEWKDEFASCRLIVVEDHATQEIETPRRGFVSVGHFTWKDIRADFGENEWIFPRQNAGIRSYGFWKAYTEGADIIITLDDDCFPVGEGFVAAHLSNMESRAPTDWFPTFPHPEYMYTRGYPYRVRGRSRVVISHGLWSNKMDMDAKTQLAIGDVNVPAYPPIRQAVPHGMYFPMSSMNLAFVRDVLPLMYFPLMGNAPDGTPWGFDRYDDIWAGIAAKKILDHLRLSVVNGSPFVEHRKASDPIKNKEKELAGMEANETLWQTIRNVTLTAATPVQAYLELAETWPLPKTPYFSSLRRAMLIWGRLFE